jgi:hypothetical protein
MPYVFSIHYLLRALILTIEPVESAGFLGLETQGEKKGGISGGLSIMKTYGNNSHKYSIEPVWRLV